MKRRRAGTGRCNRDRCMRRDDHGVTAASLDHRRFHACGASCGDRLGRRHRTGEGDRVGAAGCDQGFGHGRATRQATQQAIRQTAKTAHEFQRTQRGGRCRLDYAGVAAGERRGHGPAHQQDGEIKRHDMDAHAQSFVAHVLQRAGLGGAGQLAGIIARHLGVVAKNRCAVGQFANRFRIGFAHFARHQLGAVAQVGRLDGIS